VAERQVHIFDEDPLNVTQTTPQTIEVHDHAETRVVVIEVPGMRGAKGEQGDQGPPGFSGAGEPFFVITSGSMYASTASIALLSTVSSSLIPNTGSALFTGFTLGTPTSPWKSVYLTESVVWSSASVELVSLRAGPNYVRVGTTVVATASLGFTSGSTSHDVLRRVAADQQTLSLRSGSLQAVTVNNQGVFVLGPFPYTPDPVSGGIFKSGSDFFFGV
jgi:hypothetical protein